MCGLRKKGSTRIGVSDDEAEMGGFFCLYVNFYGDILHVFLRLVPFIA